MRNMTSKTDEESILIRQVKLLERNQAHWKAKYKEAKVTIKQLSSRVRFLEERKEYWKQKAKKLKAEQKELQRQIDAKKKEFKIVKKELDEQSQQIIDLSLFSCIPAHHKYSLGQIYLFISLVLSASTTFRGASRALDIIYTTLALPFQAPSWASGRMWVLRLGYYKLTRPKKLANDWVWIIDHTVQLGSLKCLLILGIQLANLPSKGNSLTHLDVEPIALLPVRHSNGQIVYQQLEESVVKTGVPRQIVADYGSDVKSGIKKFCTIHSETDFIYDIKHKMAAILKKELKDDAAWISFIKLASQSKNKIQQTSLAPLAPPNQRAKARYMNVDLLIRWGSKILNLLDKPILLTNNQFDLKQVTLKLGWVSNFRQDILRWQELLLLVTTTEKMIRKQGLDADSQQELQKNFEKLTPHEQTQKVREELLQFVGIEASKCKPKERLLGSSEVIESVFGKLKHLEQEQAKSGFTPLLLSVAAMLSTTDSQVVQTALSTVRTEEVKRWSEENLGKSVQARRKKVFQKRE